MRGLTKRHPTVLSATAGGERSQGARALEHDLRSAGHALDSARHEEVSFAGANGVGSGDHCLQAGAAEPVHGLSRHLDRKPREQRCHAGDVSVVLARLVGATEDHVVDALGRDAGRDRPAPGSRQRPDRRDGYRPAHLPRARSGVRTAAVMKASLTGLTLTLTSLLQGR